MSTYFVRFFFTAFPEISLPQWAFGALAYLGFGGGSRSTRRGSGPREARAGRQRFPSPRTRKARAPPELLFPHSSTVPQTPRAGRGADLVPRPVVGSRQGPSAEAWLRRAGRGKGGMREEVCVAPGRARTVGGCVPLHPGHEGRSRRVVAVARWAPRFGVGWAGLYLVLKSRL